MQTQSVLGEAKIINKIKIYSVVASSLLDQAHRMEPKRVNT